MIAAAYFDPYASIGSSDDEEYQEAEDKLKENCFPDENLIFKRKVFPHQLANSNVRLYLFDIGGISCNPGANYDHLYNSLAEQARDRPDTLFVLWSAFTCRYFFDIVTETYPDLVKLPNIVYAYDPKEIWGPADGDVCEKIKAWFAVGKKE